MGKIATDGEHNDFTFYKEKSKDLDLERKSKGRHGSRKVVSAYNQAMDQKVARALRILGRFGICLETLSRSSYGMQKEELSRQRKSDYHKVA